MVVRVLNEFLIEVSEQINVNFDDENWIIIVYFKRHRFISLHLEVKKSPTKISEFFWASKKASTPTHLTIKLLSLRFVIFPRFVAKIICIQKNSHSTSSSGKLSFLATHSQTE